MCGGARRLGFAADDETVCVTPAFTYKTPQPTKAWTSEEGGWSIKTGRKTGEPVKDGRRRVRNRIGVSASHRFMAARPAIWEGRSEQARNAYVS